MIEDPEEPVRFAPQSEAEGLLAMQLLRDPDFDQAALERLCLEQPSLAPALRTAFEALTTTRRYLGPHVAGDPDEQPLRHAAFQDLGELGRGGMGIVRHVHDPELRRELAAKVLRTAQARDPRARSRFVAEAQVTSQLDHPGIVAVHGMGVDESGRPFFTMKLVRGQSLAQVFDDRKAGRGEWSVTRVLGMLLRICEAVAYAHEKGVVHRDLKPGNVMIGPFGEVLVMDWGLSSAAGEAGPQSVRSDLRRDLPESPLLTAGGDVVGTPYYMAPEQALGQGHVAGEPCDIYAIGAILYHLLAGEPPYRRSGGTDTAQVWRLAQTEPPEPLRRISRDAPPELAAICERAMAREPGDRYPSMQSLRADLAAWLEGRVVQAYERGPWASVRKWVLRNRALSSLLVLLVIAVPLVLGLWSFARSQSLQAARSRLFRYREEINEAQRAAAAIYPAWPANVPVLERWLEEHAAPLAGAVDEIARIEEVLAADLSRDEPWAAFLRDTHQGLLADLQRFHDPERGLLADVRRRLHWAKSVPYECIDRHRALWDEAREAIARADGVTASTLYRARPTLLEPEWDLVPIGMNPVTRLWEFHHLPTAGEQALTPKHDAEGEIEVGPDAGIVFVLVPGGTFVMGADSDPHRANYDELAEGNESPAHAVTLDAFFIARHELTVVQWYRLRGDRSVRAPAAAARPITFVAWGDATKLLATHGLYLPTEAQWEYAARAGSTTRYWSGDDADALQGIVNIADRSARRGGQWWPGLEEQFDDGISTWSPVDGLRANRFGLHHVHGNVSEWVRDTLTGYQAAPRAGDGLRGDFASGMKVCRGGSFSSPARRTRSSFRGVMEPLGTSGVGLRAARPLRGSPNTSDSLVAPAKTIVRWDANGHHYELIDVKLSWTDAREDAAARTLRGVRGHLVTITSAEENSFVTTRLNTANAWLGGYQDELRAGFAEPGGGWAWVTGEPFGFASWAQWSDPQPSNLYLGVLGSESGDAPFGCAEDVIQFWAIDPSSWNDVPNHPHVRLPYVIEFDTEVAGGSGK